MEKITSSSRDITLYFSLIIYPSFDSAQNEVFIYFVHQSRQPGGDSHFRGSENIDMDLKRRGRSGRNIYHTDYEPLIQVALRLLGLNLPLMRLSNTIFSPFTLGPGSSGVIQTTLRVTRARTSMITIREIRLALQFLSKDFI